MLLSVAAVLLLFSCTSGENPAIQVLLTNKGLQYGKHAGTDWIQRILEFVTLPDFSGQVPLIHLFNIDFTLTGTKIKKCDLPEPSTEFYPDSTGFKTSLSGLSVALSGQWSTDLRAWHDSGTFDMAVFGVNVTSVVKLGKDAGGHLSVTSVSCDAQVGHVDVSFRGGTRWTFWPFVKKFRRMIRSQIEIGICPYVKQLIGNLEQHLQAMNVSFDVDQALTLDLALTSLPVVNVSSLNLGLKGEFYSIKTHAEPPFEAQSFTVPEQQGYMFSLGLSDFTVNSALYGYYSDGVFQTCITDSMIPPGFPLHLNTSLMGPYIPQLPKMFPGLLMNLHVYATEFPVFSFHPDAVNLGFQGAVEAFAIQPNATRTPLFKLSVVSNFSSKVWIAGETVKGSVSMDKLTLTLVGSDVGTFKTDALEEVARIGVEMVLAKVNETLGEGIPLPRMIYAQLVNSVLKVQEGFVVLFSDVEVLTDRGFSLHTNRAV
ncbi:bactericidal permeability-increasing protein [Hippoglossus hippoglossus]|uniref:bactericidal permeability-increasing protein n=1 Tax=Hippoglossus hippoglossus TaxID=8267 RepID=UPI00148BF676|nr:bactericidal permeability-increasing protein [Hippoglossus hippoglossus]